MSRNRNGAGLSKSQLKKCRYENLLRLAKFLGLNVGDNPSPGYLAYVVSRVLK